MKLPEEFKRRMQDMLGAEYDAFLKEYEKPRKYGLRLNTLKMTPEEFENKVNFPLQRVPWTENGYYYEANLQPSKNPLYFAGLYYLQEPSAMAPASRLPVEPGDKVLDLCAAPGGKATELANRLQGKGLLVANEISASRAKALLKNIEVSGISNALITNATPRELAERFPGFFDKILVDAPCSGEGMFRKEENVMAAWEPNRPDYFANLQKDILDQAIAMLKPGGLLLYSTCTFSPVENEGSISGALERHPEMTLLPMKEYTGFAPGRPEWGNGNRELEKTIRLWPHKLSGEGHFMALMKKEGTLDPVVPIEENSKARRLGRTEKEILDDFLQHIKSERFQNGLEIRKDKVYCSQAIAADLRGLTFLRNGLYMGDMKKNRFEPSQALAMALKAEEYDFVLSFQQDDERLIRYLKGETLIPDKKQEPGWYLICVENLPLGWGKITGNVVKNKYFNAWRMN